MRDRGPGGSADSGLAGGRASKKGRHWASTCIRSRTRCALREGWMRIWLMRCGDARRGGAFMRPVQAGRPTVWRACVLRWQTAACDGRKRRITRVAAERVRPRHRVRPVVARRDGWRARERPMAHRPVRAAAYPVRRCGRWSRRPSKQRSGGRALCMQIGGLVRHRVASKHRHALAGTGTRTHARTHRSIRT